MTRLLAFLVGLGVGAAVAALAWLVGYETGWDDAVQDLL